MSNEIKLTSNWDKVFPKSNKVNHNKVTFKNRFGIVIAVDLYEPKIIKEKLPALAVSGPFGAIQTGLIRSRDGRKRISYFSLRSLVHW